MLSLRSSSCSLLLLITAALWLLTESFVISPQPSHNLLSKHRRSLPLRSIRSFEGSQISTRVQKIKDMYVTKEILNDITTAEFALIVDMRNKEDTIDYSMLISRLDRDISRLSARNIAGDAELNMRITDLKASLSKKFQDKAESETVFVANVIKPKLDATNTEKEVLPSLRILVREDGTVDWEDALASGKEVAKFGTELWERLNGKEEGPPSISELFGQVSVKIPVTDEINKLETLVNSTQRILFGLKQERDQLRGKLVSYKKDSQQIPASDLKELRSLEFRLKEQEKRLKLLKLDLDMEQICVCLEQDAQSSSDPSDQKLIVAQVALIERQLRNIIGGLPPLDKQNFDKSDSEDVSLSTLVDDDELALVILEVNDLKSRLSIDSQSGRGVDWGTLGVFTRDSLAKIKEGLNFFGEGIKILTTDLAYAWSLLVKAAQGYTLKPREVNSMRRVGKDVLTLIPFTIILIIPLSPIGHVLVFSFMQRFFPDFFPTGFTEKRQNLRRIYANIERKTDDDFELDPTPSKNVDFDLQEKLSESFSGPLAKLKDTINEILAQKKESPK